MVVELDNQRFTTLIVDPKTALAKDIKFHCLYCGHWLMSMNKKFAIVSQGLEIMGVDMEVPTTVFRVTKMCGSCRHYYIIYFDNSYEG